MFGFSTTTASFLAGKLEKQVDFGKNALSPNITINITLCNVRVIGYTFSF